MAGGAGRKTRFHTEQGQFVPIGELRHLPKVGVQWISRKVLGSRPEEPWWPIPAIREIEAFMASRACRVIEFGSGSSTAWLARRATHVYAIEDDELWFQKVKKQLSQKGLRNIDLVHREDAEYYDLSWIKDPSFDLAIVDGSWRWKCIESVLPCMKKGGILYLDNSDADKDNRHYPGDNEKRKAQKILGDFIKYRHDARLYQVTSLISGEMHVGSGAFLRI